MSSTQIIKHNLRDVNKRPRILDTSDNVLNVLWFDAGSKSIPSLIKAKRRFDRTLRKAFGPTMYRHAHNHMMIYLCDSDTLDKVIEQEIVPALSKRIFSLVPDNPNKGVVH